MSKYDVALRKLIAYGYYAFSSVLKLGSANKGKGIDRIIYYPSVKDIGVLADLVNRISWYFPQTELARPHISIIVDSELADVDMGALTTPPYQERYIGLTDNIDLINGREADLGKADVIMLWDSRYLLNPTVLKYSSKVNIVDPGYYFSVEGDTHRRMYLNILPEDQRERLLGLSRRNYQALQDDLGACDKGYVFGTGPSLDRAMEFDYGDGFRVVCNSIVKNKPLLDHIKPHLLIFGDPIFHYSPCRYAEEFRKMVLEVVNKYQCYVLTQEYSLPLYLAHYPELENKLIGMPGPGVWEMSFSDMVKMVLRKPLQIPWFDRIPGHDEEYNFPTAEKFYVRLTGSILPSYMVSVASSFCKEISIIGADGYDPNERKPDGTSVWSYSSSSQLNDMMRTAIMTHPSYFRDQPYTFNYQIYCKNFERLINYGESLGKTYYSLTPSYIPVLSERLAP